MPEEDPHVRIGRLRWLVTLATRVQTPEGLRFVSVNGGLAGPVMGTGITETTDTGNDDFAIGFGSSSGALTVHADVQAVGGLTFYGAEQTDTPITHRIFMRWHDYLSQANAVLRDTLRPDGTHRREVFRVRRVKELGGRKRFVMIEAELESAA